MDSPRFIDDGDTIVVPAAYFATNNPTGKQVIEPVAHVWELKDRKIVRLHQYVDTASINNSWKLNGMISTLIIVIQPEILAIEQHILKGNGYDENWH